ncbi:hypothetical protein [Streptomyces sp. NPDC057428]|uniref:hypothetical protein n=1 Tax=Streptomyces sp. NPDC057428 TaxID=3346129 RepID=UPI0036836F9E
MTFDEAVAAVSEWGEPRVVGPRPHSPLVTVSSTLDEVAFQVLLEEEDRVTAIELWWPGEGRWSSTRVLLDGEDIFTTPARQILEHAAARGWTIEDAQTENPVIPGVSLGFTRQTSQEMPRDSDGRLMYFTSVLVGGEKYFDFRADPLI